MTYTFKTSINCSSCVRAVSPSLNSAPIVKNWTVDTTHADKLLSVETDATVTEIVAIVKDAGFEIELKN